MNKTRLIIIILVISFILVIIFMLPPRGWKAKFISPMGQLDQTIQKEKNSLPTPTSSPPNAPKTFQFGASTDLKQELDNINPQVLDSDFE